MPDVIVIGAGHNGLTAAAYLARAGKKVLVLDARDVVGGLCWTMELPGAPGYKVNPGGCEFLLTGVEPSVDTELELHKYGLRWAYPETLLTWLGPEGQVMPIWKDRARLVEEIRRYSHRDAVKYVQLCDQMTDTLQAILPYLQGHPTQVRPKVLWEMLTKAAKGRKNIARGARIMLSSLETVVEEYFERDEIKIPMASYSLANFGPINEPGSGFHMTLCTGLHTWGMRHPIGGSGAFTQALAACVEAHNGYVRTGAKVREVTVHNGKASGVVLETGEQINAEQVIAAVDPKTLLTKLLDPADVPLQAQEEMRGMQSLRNNMYTFKLDAALTERPRFAHHVVPDDAVSAITICPTMDYLKRSTNAAAAGTFSDEIAFNTIMSSVHDRSLVPEGSTGDTIYFYAYNTPVELSDGRDWHVEKKLFADTMLDLYEQYAPGFKKSIIDVDTTSPPEFETRYNLSAGNYEHADVIISQMGPWRPIPSMAGYKTPVENLWHSGAGAFPMAFLSGWPGRNTANMLLRRETSTGRLLHKVGLA
jgi:beta-carotene ketolase (CrtO type)